MEPGVRIAAAASVLLAGMLAALLCRPSLPRSNSTIPGGDRLTLGRQLQPQVSGLAPGGPHGGAELLRSVSSSDRAAERKATILTPVEPAEAPPVLAKDYPGDAVAGASAWGALFRLSPSARCEQPVRRHKIIDGDTLRTLAKRYLGSPDRSLEIYQANRDLLPSPELLPIGMELTIPPWPRPVPPSQTRQPKAESGEPILRGPLVPIPQAAAAEG